MALPRSLHRLARLGLVSSSTRASSRAPPSTCNPKPRPPCPPCVPQPRPPCRSGPNEEINAVRITCCPPRQGLPPPCAKTPPACSLSCKRANVSEQIFTSNRAAAGNDSCGSDRNRIARRLADAREARRADYMREIATRRPPPPPNDPPYRLPGPLQCKLATDGKKYTISSTSPTSQPCAPCGPCREPPPPSKVKLLPDKHCQVRREPTINPCAHSERTIIEINRIKTTSKMPVATPPSVCKKLSTRIMRSLNLRSGEVEKKAGPSCGEGGAQSKTAEKGEAKHAGDTSWCESLRPPKSVGPACRRPGPGERFRRKPCQRRPPARSLHTDALKHAGKTDDDGSRRLESVLRERAELKEIARGRVVRDKAFKNEEPRAAGGLDLAVPSGATTLRVRVALDSTKDQCPSTAKSENQCASPSKLKDQCAPATKSCAALSSTPVSALPHFSRAVSTDGKSDSWIKGLQKKIVETCLKNDSSATTANKSKCPCAPKKPVISPCSPNAPKVPSKPPCAKPLDAPRKSPCSQPPQRDPKPCGTKRQKKPTCFSSTIVLLSSAV